MAQSKFDPGDLEKASELLSQRSSVPPLPADVALVAGAISTERRSRTPGSVSDDELLAAHDQLCGPLRHQAHGVLESLATAMLARGLVPGPGAYGDEWWLWWPKKGRGPCQHCGKERSLTRYMARYALPERYLCQRCRRQETTDPRGEGTGSPFHGQLAAIIKEAREAGAREAGPSDETWGKWAAAIEALLRPLEWAGWEVPEAYDSEFDYEDGALLYGELRRTGMVIDFEYRPIQGELNFHPFEGDGSPNLSMISDAVVMSVGRDTAHGAGLVAEVAGELGLLDATRVAASAESDVSTGELVAEKIIEWLLSAAASYRDMPLPDLMEQLMADEQFSATFKMLTEFLAPNVLPDLIPDAAAIGIVNWCWRNGTAVEDWHLPTDALMAKVSITATKAVMPHVDPWEGVDWQGVEDTLTSPAWQLADGRAISDLFGEGWREIQRTVREQVRKWRRFDEDLIGPEATLRLLTMGGSTSYTRHWWGQGRWPAICKAIVADATAAGIALPAPYDAKGTEVFLHDLKEPDALSDEALAWMIDLPGPGTDGPRGLRYHDSTKPLVRDFELYTFAINEENEE